MTENSASLGVPPRAGPPRNVSTSHGGVSTTFQSCQSLAMGAVSAAIRLSSGECRLKVSPISPQPAAPDLTPLAPGRRTAPRGRRNDVARRRLEVKKWAIAFQTVFVFASVAAEWGREAALGRILDDAQIEQLRLDVGQNCKQIADVFRPVIASNPANIVLERLPNRDGGTTPLDDYLDDPVKYWNICYAILGALGNARGNDDLARMGEGAGTAPSKRPKPRGLPPEERRPLGHGSSWPAREAFIGDEYIARSSPTRRRREAEYGRAEKEARKSAWDHLQEALRWSGMEDALKATPISPGTNSASHRSARALQARRRSRASGSTTVTSGGASRC